MKDMLSFLFGSYSDFKPKPESSLIIPTKKKVVYYTSINITLLQ